MKLNPRRRELAVYPNRFEVASRFSDLDTQWHVNNVRLLEYYQEARILFHRRLCDEFDFDLDKVGRLLVAHMSVDYLQEIRYPGIVTLGIGILRVGNSSYTLGAGMFQEERCAGLAMTVLVNAGKDGPARLPAEFVTILRKKQLPDDAP